MFIPVFVQQPWARCFAQCLPASEEEKKSEDTGPPVARPVGLWLICISDSSVVLVGSPTSNYCDRLLYILLYRLLYNDCIMKKLEVFRGIHEYEGHLKRLIKLKYKAEHPQSTKSCRQISKNKNPQSLPPTRLRT